MITHMMKYFFICTPGAIIYERYLFFNLLFLRKESLLEKAPQNFCLEKILKDAGMRIAGEKEWDLTNNKISINIIL